MPDIVKGLKVPGRVGVVVALMEEESFTDDGAAAGHVAFNNALEEGINEITATLGVTKQEPTPEDIEKLTAQIHEAVKAAVIGTQSFLRNFLSIFDADKLIAVHMFDPSGDELLQDPVQAIEQRFQRIMQSNTFPPTPPTTFITDDYELFGEIRRDPATDSVM